MAPDAAIVLADRFELVAHLGTGGMGAVYRARDRTRGQEVALKVLPQLDATALARFKNEFRALHDIQHPNLVLLHELHEAAGTWFFTMQLVDGVDLLTWLGGHRRAEQITQPRGAAVHESPDRDELPPCDEARLRAVLPQIARGLHRLHGAGLVHRDVKPTNILVTASGRAFLLDFGLVARSRSHGEAIGTPDFMAPEQVEGQVGPASDWYAVGALMFRALTGIMPFLGTPEDVLRAKVERPAPLVGDVRASAPGDLAALTDALLAREPGSRPRGEAILAALGAGNEPPSVVGPALVGRDRELAVLRAAFADRMRGDTFSVRVTGESGIGKTALLRAFADETERAGRAWVLGGRCWERESVPYKGLDGVIDDLASRLAARPDPTIADPRGFGSVLVRAFPVLRRVPAFSEVAPVSSTSADRHETVARVSSAARWLLAEIAAREPLVVAIDDLQWVAPDTMTVLHGILDPPLPGVLFVFGVRDRGPTLRGDVRTVALGPLSSDDGAALVDLLVRDLRGLPSPRGLPSIDAAAIAREARGHPLFTAELVRHAIATGELGSVTFDQAVRRVAERFGPEAHRILTVVSLAHAPISIEAAARAAGDDGAAFFDALAALRTGQLVATTGIGADARLEPYHDRIRHAFTTELAAGARKDLHHRIASALEAWPAADAEALALHWNDAGRPVAAARHALRAAEQATTVLAFHRAARLYHWAAELAPAACDHEQLRIKYAESLAQAGLGAEAATAFLACARDRDGVTAADFRRRAMQQLLLMGHTDRALGLLDELMGELELPNPVRRRGLLLALLARRAAVRIRKLELSARSADTLRPFDRARIDLTWDAAAGLALIDPLRCFYFQSLNLDLCFRSGDASRLTRALLGEAPYLASSGRMTRRLERILELVDDAAARASLPAVAHIGRGTASFLMGRWTDALVRLDEAERLLAQTRPRLVDEGFGLAQLLGMTRSMPLASLLYLGRLSELVTRTPELLRDAVERNDMTAATYFRTGTQSLMHLAIGDVDAATRNADAGLHPWRGSRGRLPNFMDLHARASIDLYLGRGDAAHQRVLETWPDFEESQILRTQYVAITLLDTRARSALAAAAKLAPRQRGALLVAARRDARALERARAVWSVPLGHAIRACASLLDGGGDADRWLDRAARGFDAAEMRLHGAGARLVRARIAGDRAHAANASRSLASAGVADPERFVGVLLPTAE